MDVDENADEGNREPSAVGVKRTQAGAAKARASQDTGAAVEVCADQLDSLVDFELLIL